MPIQGTIVLDSGAFLTDEVKNLVSEVGYFKPNLIIYDDYERVKEIKLPEYKRGETVIHVRHLDASGNELTDGVQLSNCLVKHLLRMRELYDDEPNDETLSTTKKKKGKKTEEPLQGANVYDFDCIFRFTSGKFRSSMVKHRDFKELDPDTNEPTGNRRPFKKPIAHDIVVSFDLKDGEVLKLVMVSPNRKKEKVLWSSSKEPSIRNRFDIEIIAENGTAMDYFRNAVRPTKGKKYWIPNQGEPPPHWRHPSITE